MDSKPAKSLRPHHRGTRHASIVDIPLAIDLTLEIAEQELARSVTDKIKTIRVNLSRCRSIDVVALLYIVALTARRTAVGLATHYKLPEDHDARDYLRRRGFAQAIENVTDVPFRLLVDENWFESEEPSRAL